MELGREQVALAHASSMCWALCGAVVAPVELWCPGRDGFHFHERCTSVRTQLLLLCSHSPALLLLQSAQVSQSLSFCLFFVGCRQFLCCFLDSSGVIEGFFPQSRG